MLQRRPWIFAVLWLALLRFSPAVQLASAQTTAATPANLPNLAAVTLPGVHDPSLIKAGDTWYIFSSGGRRDGAQLPIHCSTDLTTWTPCGHVFDQLPPWIPTHLPGVQELWAPDISFEDGEFRLYYAYSVLGKTTSGIALATNKTLDRTSPDYAWVDHGEVLETHAGDDYNAIDPNFLRDGEGSDWLVFGSFWSGIKLRQLGPDGLLSPKKHKLYSLARRAPPPGASWPPSGTSVPWQAIEAPFLVHHGSFFYLFTSWDHCCRGADSNYHVVVGRATKVTGPYRDEAGHKLTGGGGTTLLAGNTQWAGPGGQSIWMNPNGEDLLVYHAYDGITGQVSLRLAPILWNKDWPVIQGGP